VRPVANGRRVPGLSGGTAPGGNFSAAASYAVICRTADASETGATAGSRLAWKTDW